MATRILALRQGEKELRRATVEELGGLLAEETTMVWVDMTDPDAADKRILDDVFKFHPTVVEDMLADAPTPKVQRFPDYLYLVFHGLLEGAEIKGEVQTCDLDIFLGKNYLLSSHDERLPAGRAALERVKRDPELLRKGPAFITYYLVDDLVDRYLPLVEKLDHSIDAIETSITKGTAGPQILEEIFDIRHRLQRLRRIGVHQRDILNRLSRGDFELVPEDARPFFRDAYDNFVRVTDLSDSFREIINGAMEAHISVQGHKLNEIMKVLTLMSTIMLPLTFIAGLYGMNFEDMPELHWSFGYPLALLMMALTAVGLTLFFRRRGWL